MEFKEIHYDNHQNLGRMGECTNIFSQHGNELKVGDIVSFLRNNKIRTGIVAKNLITSEYFVLGIDDSSSSIQHATKVLSYKYLTEDILNELSGYIFLPGEVLFKIKKVIKKEMTIEQIEKELGYGVKIVKDI